MKKGYSFLSDYEPSDEQLSFIMKEVAIEAKRKAVLANMLFWEQLDNMVKTAQVQELAKAVIK